MSEPLLVIAAGGTGGHMFPAQALAEQMLGRGWRVNLLSDGRGLRYADAFPEAVERTELRSASFQQGGLGARVAAPLALMNGTMGALRRFRSDRPAAVAGFGGYPAFPALAAAVWRHIPSLIHEQNGVLGRVNRLFARRVARVACGTWPLTNAPKGADLVRTGNPVRGSVHSFAGTPYQPPDDGPLNLLVFGGSQGASVFSRLMPVALTKLPSKMRTRLRLTQQVRQGEKGDVANAYAEAGIEADLAPFFEDMPRRIAEAQLVICRAGASTVAELSAIGRPAILVPYPAAMDDHQTANARALSEAGGAILAPESTVSPSGMADLVREVLDEPAKAAAMAEKARRQGNPNAASDLADLVEELSVRATSA